VDGLIPREGGFLSAPRKYPEELRERTERMVAEAREQDGSLSLHAAVNRIGPRWGFSRTRCGLGVGRPTSMRVSLSGGSVNVEYLPLGARSTSSSASSRQDSAASSSSTSPIRTPQRPSADQYRAEGNGKDVALDESVMGSRISRAAGLVPPNTFKPLYGSCGSRQPRPSQTGDRML